VRPARVALREARMLFRLRVAAALFLLAAVGVPYVSRLGVDSAARVASDAAYIWVVLSVHGLAILVAAAAARRGDGTSAVLRTRGVGAARELLERAVGFGMWGAFLAAASLSGAALGAHWAGAPDPERVLIPLSGMPATFGLALLLSVGVPGYGGALLAGGFVVIGHFLEVASIETPLLAWILPRYALFDAWPGTVVTLSDLAGRLTLALVYVVGAAILASSLSAMMERHRSAGGQR
jgi:hypothetical protein